MLSLIKLFKPIAIPRTCTQWACFLKYFLQVLQNKLMMESESLLWNWRENALDGIGVPWMQKLRSPLLRTTAIISVHILSFRPGVGKKAALHAQYFACCQEFLPSWFIQLHFSPVLFKHTVTYDNSKQVLHLQCDELWCIQVWPSWLTECSESTIYWWTLTQL